jgi:hypothetical protein
VNARDPQSRAMMEPVRALCRAALGFARHAYSFQVAP